MDSEVIPAPDAVAYLAANEPDEEFGQSLIDLLQYGCIEAFRRPDGAIAFRMAAEGHELMTRIAEGGPSVHRFGTHGEWTSAEGVVFSAELSSADDPHCPDCDSIVTGLRSSPGGPLETLGVTHAPGCPWLTAKIREIS